MRLALQDGWKDVQPIPQADSVNPMVPINYSQECMQIRLGVDA